MGQPWQRMSVLHHLHVDIEPNFIHHHLTMHAIALCASRTHRMWITLGTAKVIADRVPEPARRHVYNLDRPVRAGAIRVLLSAAETSIDELEAYSLPVFS